MGPRQYRKYERLRPGRHLSVRFWWLAPLLFASCGTSSGSDPATLTATTSNAAADGAEPVADAGGPPTVAKSHGAQPATSASTGVPVVRDASPPPALSGSSGVKSDKRDAAVPKGCPDEMARIGRYCIDRYEAHLVRREGADRWVMHSPVERLSPGVHYEARSEPGVYPQAYISRNEAQEACRNAGKRLCTWIEWRRGCQGRRWLRYPYGWSERRGRCNTGKAHVLPELFGFDTSKWHYEEVFNSPLCNLEPGYLATSGSYEKCVSDDQIYDMVGNLHEWVSTPVTEKFLEVIEKDDVQRNEQPWREGNGMFLGGFYSTTSEHGPGCMYVTMAHEPSYHDYSTGFRCCKKAKGRTVRMRPKR